jgi:hypothetical protein
MHLAKGQSANNGERTLYVVDESSLASTKQMHDFMTRLHPNDRVLLVGDTRQHEAVEAARPFAQLQEAGMVTVKLEEIVRQKDPELKNVVEQLARDEAGGAVQGLERQGRVHEVKDPAQRIEAIAKEYARSPDNTLVVWSDNRSRIEINVRFIVSCRPKGSSAEMSIGSTRLFLGKTSLGKTGRGRNGTSATMCSCTRAARKRWESRRASMPA